MGNAVTFPVIRFARPGSSPQAWGTLERGGGGTASVRFIPTGVGNAHPDQATDNHPNGSSPQAWGTHKLRIRFGVTIRFIPTGVGNALTFPVQQIDGTVHPHRRGERTIDGEFSDVSGGSSPQAWGTQHEHRPNQ